jgi:6-phosphogluconolactonase
MTTLVVAATADELVRTSAEWLEAEIGNAIGTRGSCALALAGGKTPEPVYRELAKSRKVDWSKVDVYFGDERAVPPDHPESNYGMVMRALRSSAGVRPERVHRMEAERADRDQAAREYERLLAAPLDVLVLGIGQDGHTASLFPGSSALAERRRLVLPVLGTKPPPERLTITPPVIESARRVAVIASGADKAAMVARSVEGPWAPEDVPAQLARRGHWFLDRSAASQLTERALK